MTQTQDALARAIDFLGAIEVAPGRFAVQDTATSRWYVQNEHDLRLVAEDREGYFTGAAVLLPAWWTPEQRRRSQCHGCKRAWPCGAPGNQVSHLLEWVAVDYETGEEIEA